MNTNLKEQTATREDSRQAGAEQRLKELGIKLPAPPEEAGPRRAAALLRSRRS